MDRQELIHSKGFNILFGDASKYADQYGKIKVGPKELEDAVLTFGSLPRILGRPFSKMDVLKALYEKDLPTIREISNHFYNISGVYQRACDYFANMYRYDWYLEPEIYDDKGLNQEKIISDFIKRLNYLDNSHIKKMCGDIALKVILNGAYYGYVVEDAQALSIQELPPSYCRSRYSIRGIPTVEFNMKFFDDRFKDTAYRLRVLKMFPKEFQKGYLLYKEGKLVPEETILRNTTNYGWYLLDPEKTIKFNLNNSDIPIFISAIPAILDLDAAQDLDRRKQMQQLLKILIQKLPLDKNGDLIFDVEEAQDLHNTTVNMLKRTIGVDVVTTFADIDSIDLSDKNSATTTDDLNRVERTVYNALGLSKNLFNTDGNLSLTKSILEDESTMRNLILQFEIFFDQRVASKIGAQKKIKTRFYMLQTTQYNYIDLSKMYKEQSQVGYSKIYSQIALGHSQSSIINTAYFENHILNLQELMIPPLMSSTMNGTEILDKKDQNDTKKNQDSTKTEEKTSVTTKKVKTVSDKKTGRPEKAEGDKSDKTLANQESLN